jgi:hypothetical protein
MFFFTTTRMSRILVDAVSAPTQTIELERPTEGGGKCVKKRKKTDKESSYNTDNGDQEYEFFDFALLTSYSPRSSIETILEDELAVEENNYPAPLVEAKMYEPDETLFQFRSGYVVFHEKLLKVY